jgi:acetylxylan esterase
MRGKQPLRVFSHGQSSGAMMTQVLLGVYPDLFAAGSGFAGVPFGCMAPYPDNEGVYAYWNTACIAGNITHSPTEWADLVRGAYPSYDGWRPKLQLWHGTKDKVLYYPNFEEEIKQWTDLFGLSGTPSRVLEDEPVKGTRKMEFGTGGWFEAYSVVGGNHYIPLRENEVMRFFDLACTEGCFRWGQGGP